MRHSCMIPEQIGVRASPLCTAGNRWPERQGRRSGQSIYNQDLGGTRFIKPAGRGHQPSNLHEGDTVLLIAEWQRVGELGPEGFSPAQLIR
jgi:hypothetical protein